MKRQETGQVCASPLSEFGKCRQVKSVTLFGAVSFMVKYCCLTSVKTFLYHLYIPLSRPNDAEILTLMMHLAMATMYAHCANIYPDQNVKVGAAFAVHAS
jgi:hypothetical protein